jgi:hypothetical protein
MIAIVITLPDKTQVLVRQNEYEPEWEVDLRREPADVWTPINMLDGKFEVRVS